MPSRLPACLEPGQSAASGLGILGASADPALFRWAHPASTDKLGTVQSLQPRPPIPLAKVLDDPGEVRRLAARNAPYSPVQRYFANMQEQQALGGLQQPSGAEPEAAPMFVAPVFRGDWAYDEPLVSGVEPFLHNERFIEASRKLYDGSIVRPQIVYINLNLPMPLYDGGHTDIPAFRGIDRTRYPVWLLAIMGRSGLFEPWPGSPFPCPGSKT